MGAPGDHVFGSREDPTATDVENDPSFMSIQKGLLTALVDQTDVVADSQATEDEAAPSDPTGMRLIARRRDTLTTAEVNADGDNIAINATSKGQVHVYAEIGSVAAGDNNIGNVDVASIAAGSNLIGKVDHATTGIGHGVTTVTTAGTDVVLASSTPAKWVIIQSQTDNTSKIAVGATGVDATIATGTGILLDPGDAVTLPVDNLADIFIDSLVNGEGVRYTYGT